MSFMSDRYRRPIDPRARWRRGLVRGLLAGFLCLRATSVPAAEPPKVAADHAAKMKQGTTLFKERVRPLLVKHCLDCHGGKSVKGDFDLSTREKLVESGVIEGPADKMRLLALIRHDEEPHMPFKQPKLSPESIAVIQSWIELGAPYDKPLSSAKSGGEAAPMQVTDHDREFWSFRPLVPVDFPAVPDDGWCRTPLDRFIRAQQAARGLRPNPPAARRTLIRRAHLDLLGLPPTPEAVEAFVNDPDPAAYDKLVDRLLESQHYGERWARHWMDVARFAESFGYEQDYDRPNAYHYRDFLIKALNADMPYDQFVRWQLAGDELAPGDPLALMATGFLAAGSFPTQLTENEFESARYDELDDMTATTGVAFLGLSVGCARCHDHKFDPIPTRDYYRFAASFTTTIRSEVQLDLAPEENRRRRDDFERQLVERTNELRRYDSQELPDKFRAWLVGYDGTTRLAPWEVLTVESVTSSAGTKFDKLPDGSWLATGAAAPKETVTIIATTRRKNLTSLRLEALSDGSLPHKGPGRASNGNFVLGNITLAARPLAGEGEPQPVQLKTAEATHQQDTGTLAVAASLDGDPVSGWAVDGGGIGKDQAAVFRAAEPFGDASGTRLTIVMAFNHPNPQHTLGRFRLSVTDLADVKPSVGNPGPDAKVEEALAEIKRTGELQSATAKVAREWFATTDPGWQALDKEVTTLKKSGPQVQLTKVLVATEGLPHLPHHADDRGFPHFYPETFLLKRGDVQQKDSVAAAGFLQVLMPGERAETDWHVTPPAGWTRTSFRRAALANWMTDVKSGAGQLAARVIVNRMWQHHFGRGLVSTPSDFGVSGERPSHPELLDWLAHDLVTHGWRLKRLHKLMLTSAVYMQSAEFDEARARLDRDNALLWRHVPRRLEGEVIRDSLLSVAGQLDLTMYGPGTLDQAMRRRSVYYFIKRSQLIPMMMLFDWPEHLVSIGQRSRTTIAPQALLFMNSPLGRQAAEAVAKRIEGLDDVAAIRRVYALALGRSPESDEEKFASSFLEKQTAYYKTAGRDSAAHWARVDLCQALLGMSEFVFLE